MSFYLYQANKASVIDTAKKKRFRMQQRDGTTNNFPAIRTINQLQQPYHINQMCSFELIVVLFFDNFV